MQVKVNESLSNPEETLMFCGYSNPVHLEGNIYNVDSIGVSMDAIEVLTSEKNKYGELITQLREEKGMSIATLSDILVISQERLVDIEAGTAYMSPSELSMCSSIFNVSQDALVNGKIENPLNTQKQMNDSIIELLASAVKSQNELLDYIFQDGVERFQVKTRFDTDSAEFQYGFAVYDTEEDRFVMDDDGKTIICDNFEDAIAVADEQYEKLQFTEKLEKGAK